MVVVEMFPGVPPPPPPVWATPLDSQGWVDSEDYSTDVSDNPRKRGRRAEPSVLAPGGAFLDL